MEEEKAGYPRLEGMGKRYRTIALLTLNLLLLFVVCNLLSWVMVAINNRFFVPPSGSLQYGLENLRLVYPDLSDEEIIELLEETWSREYIYEPFVQHREGPLNGIYVNIDEAGYRLIANQGPWPIDPAFTNIFVFGGSTTFGYGLPDGQTIPSYLQEILNERDCEERFNVYNFGSSNYYSIQERILFESLISEGHIPDIVIFIDGLNEWDEAKYTERLSYLMSETNTQLIFRAIKELPIIELTRVIRDHFPPLEENVGNSDTMAETAAKIVERWMINRQIVEATAGVFDITPVFVWQPVPNYHYNLEAHAFYEDIAPRIEERSNLSTLQIGYELLDTQIGIDGNYPEFDNFLWLADIQEGRNEPLYVDIAHYTATFSHEIAGHIADFLMNENYICHGG